MANTNVFSVSVDGINLDRFIPADSLTEITQTSEGDSIWDYKLDSVSFNLDRGALERFKGNITEFNVDALYKKLVEIKYYGNLIFAGVVNEMSYNFEDEEVELECSSYGRVIADAEQVGTLQNLNKNDGDSMETVYFVLIAYINRWLRNNDYPFQMWQNTSTFWNPKKNPFIQVEDFTFFRNVVGEKYVTDVIVNRNVDGLFRVSEGVTDTRWRAGDLFLAVEPRGILGTLGNDVVLYPVNKDDIDKTQSVKLGKLAWMIQRNFNFVKADEWGENSNIPNWISKKFYNDNMPTFQGKAIQGETFWSVCNSEIIKVSLSQADLFYYEYKNPKAGNVQAEFAIVQNAMTWVSPNREMIFQTRDGREGLKNPKKIINLEYKTVDQKGNDVDLPNDIVISDIVRQDLVSYYLDYFNGIFNSYQLVIDKDQFDASEYPLMLKELIVKVKGQIVNVGAIKSINYLEDVLEIETQKRIA